MPLLHHAKRHGGLVALAGFFGMKVVLAIAVLKLSAVMLDVKGFALFSQFLMFSALLNLVCSGGVQNGVVRQIASANAGDEDTSARTAFRAALEVWAGASLLALLVMLFQKPISVLLTGSDEHAWIVPWITLAAILNGLGQLLNAVVIGSGRLAASAGSQALGLFVGTGAAILLLLRGDAAGAVIGFALGSLVAPVCSGLLIRQSAALSRGPVGDLVAERRWLLGYSGAFVFAAALTPAVLFGLRFIYQEAFGIAALSEWLVANRVSDVSTQMLGLFMAQWFLPRLVRSHGEEASGLIARSFAVGTALMLGPFLLFTAGASFWIPWFLSREFAQAGDFIAIYLIGDILRVATSLALHCALARRRLWAYLGLESACAILLSAITLSLVALDVKAAPLFGYVGAYAVLATGLFVMYLWHRRIVAA